LAVIATWAATVPVGCASPATDSATDAKATPPFADQLRAVREGESDRIEVAVPPGPGDWESLRGLAGLRVVVLGRGVAGDTEAAILATLPDLERLVLRQSPLADTGFAALAGCRLLRDLNVPQAACTSAGIERLAALPTLKSLRLGGSNLKGPDVARAIATLPGLTSLHLIDVAIGDDGLDALVKAPTLQNLYLDGAGVSDAAWKRYFEARPGVHVHVDQAHHDRDPRRDHE
jgi:hypothetical protein